MVGPRDGLQNEANFVETARKVELVDLLSDCGFRRIEVTSFISLRWVPQMADAGEVMARTRRRPGVVCSVLTPNLKGFEAAFAMRRRSHPSSHRWNSTKPMSPAWFR